MKKLLKMKQSPVKIKNNTGKKGKMHSAILAVLSITVIVAFIIRSFPQEIGEMVGVSGGQLKQYSDHVIAFGISALFLYLGFAMLAHPVVGVTLGLVGVIVAYFEYKKIR